MALAYLVMELLSGRTLQEQVERQGPLDANRIDKILWSLLNGLEQVHSAGFLHRDIKPPNILLDGQGRPTLIDFGASRAGPRRTLAGDDGGVYAGLRGGGAVHGGCAGPWTDIYGLAATLHHAITGQAPPNAIDRILDDTYVPLAGGNRPFPWELLAGIDVGLAVRAARPTAIDRGVAHRIVVAHFRRRRGARHSCHAGRAIRRDNGCSIRDSIAQAASAYIGCGRGRYLCACGRLVRP